MSTEKKETNETKQTPSLVPDLEDTSSLSLVGVLVSSVILLAALLAGSNLEHAQYYEFGIAVAVIAMFSALVGLTMIYLKMEDDTYIIYNHYFLFAWCFIGACFMTFGSPFVITGNGYFGSWGMVVFAGMGVGLGAEKTKEAAGKNGALIGLLISAIILLVAICSDWSDFKGSFKGELVFGVIVVCLTILAVPAIIYTDKDGSTTRKLKFPALVVFAILWFVLAGIFTFRGPFVFTGNGYFGSWGGAVTSVIAAIGTMPTSSSAEG